MARIIIDCDPGYDDAVAILYGAKKLELVGITTVFGNQGIDYTTCNALKICELAKIDVPVAKGSGTPWISEPIYASELHGKSGLDGVELPEPCREPIAEHAVDFIINEARKYRNEDNKLILVGTGPLTNIATAIHLEPRLVDWIQCISIMGGSTTRGNATPAAEFNVYSDPEAAFAVFKSGIPLYMFGLNVTREFGFTEEDIKALKNGGKVAESLGRLLARYLKQLRRLLDIRIASLHDVCALMPFIHVDFFDFEEMNVDVEMGSHKTRGMTICDSPKRSLFACEEKRGSNTVRVAIKVNNERELIDDILDTLLMY